MASTSLSHPDWSIGPDERLSLRGRRQRLALSHPDWSIGQLLARDRLLPDQQGVSAAQRSRTPAQLSLAFTEVVERSAAESKLRHTSHPPIADQTLILQQIRQQGRRTRPITPSKGVPESRILTGLQLLKVDDVEGQEVFIFKR